MASEAHIATGLAKIGMVLRTQAWRKGEALGLTPTQGQILVHLSRRGPSRIGDIAVEMGVTQPTASDAAGALIRKGHVEKRPDPTDARASRLHLSRAGREIAGALAEWPDALLGAIATLDAAERGIFLKALTRMIRELQRQGAIPVQRMCASCRYFRPNVHADPAAPHHCAFVDAAFGDASLRLDCGDHETASESEAAAAWRRFASPGKAGNADAPPAATDEAS